MKVLDCRVDWALGWANSPSLHILVDELPNQDEMRYVEYDGLFISNREGYIDALWCQDAYVEVGTTGLTRDGKRVQTDRGFAGRVFEIKMRDTNEVLRLRGPWHGNSMSQNQRVPFPLQHMECSIMSQKKSPYGWHRGHTFYSAFITLGLAHAAVREFLPDEIKICPDPHWDERGETFYTPQRIRPCADGGFEIWPKDEWGKGITIRDINEDIDPKTWDFILRTAELQRFRGYRGIPFENPNVMRIR